MQLHAGIVPSPGVLDDALEAARGLAPPTPTEVPTRGLLDRLRGRRQVAPVVAPSVTFAPAAPEEVFVRLAKFGNVTTTDADALAEVLAAAAVAWPAPMLHVSKVRVAPTPPFHVTAQLDGDLDALRDIYVNLIDAVRLQGFFLDRRSFSTVVTLGSIEAEGGGAIPDSVAGAESDHRGPRWSASHLTLLRTSFTSGSTTFAAMARLPLRDDADEPGARTGA